MKKPLAITSCILHSGLSGFRAAILASSSVLVDMNTLRNPLRNMHLPVTVHPRTIRNFAYSSRYSENF